MTDTTRRRRRRTADVMGTLVALYAVTFFIGAVLHLGLRIPVGFGVLAEPVILPATIVESLCGVALAISAYALLTRRPWAWRTTFTAHVFALAGVLLGIVAQAVGGGGTTLNTTYHLTMVVLLTGGLAALSRPATRAALRAT